MSPHDHELRPEIAPAGSFLQDLQVTDDGATVFIADASIWRKQPAIVVYDVANARSAARSRKSRVGVCSGLRDQDSRQRNVLPRRACQYESRRRWHRIGCGKRMALLRRGQSRRFVPHPRGRFTQPDVCRRASWKITSSAIATKPLSDGLSTDVSGNVYVTDVEHGSIVIVDRDRTPSTLVQSPRIRWADALSFGPDGWLYLADSALAEQILQDQRTHSRAGSVLHFSRPDGRRGHSGALTASFPLVTNRVRRLLRLLRDAGTVARCSIQT